MAAHERSSSTRLVAVLRIMSKRFTTMCVWSNSPGLILGCVGTGTVMGGTVKIGKASKRD
jgi:hypothetical protein